MLTSFSKAIRALLASKNIVAVATLAAHVVNNVEKDMPEATGEEKFKAALGGMVEAVADAGIEAGGTILRKFIQDAVVMLKAKKIIAEKPPTPAKEKKKK